MCVPVCVSCVFCVSLHSIVVLEHLDEKCITHEQRHNWIYAVQFMHTHRGIAFRPSLEWKEESDTTERQSVPLIMKKDNDQKETLFF